MQGVPLKHHTSSHMQGPQQRPPRTWLLRQKPNSQPPFLLPPSHRPLLLISCVCTRPAHSTALPRFEVQVELLLRHAASVQLHPPM